MSSDSQPGHLAESIDYMDAALYKAAARGDIEVFNSYQGFELKSLLTPDNNTVLHVNLASPHVHLVSLKFFGLSDFDASQSRFQNLSRRFLLANPVVLKFLTKNFERIWSGHFTAQILNKCPSLLLQANTKGQTPLHIAAKYRPSAIVKFLIQFQARAGHRDLEQRETAVEAVRMMIRMTDVESNTALHIAAQYAHPRVVKELLEFEDPDFPYSINRKQESPLYIAASRGDGTLLGMILGKLKSVTYGGPHGRTALHAAAMAGDAEATRIILEKRRNLTKERDEDGHTPLHYAAHLGHSSVVEELLKWDISAAYVTDKKWEMTPLLMAARQGHGHIVTKFLSVCPDCSEKVSKIGWNLLHFVGFRNSPSALSDFIFKYGDVISPCGSFRNLIGAEDALGITPRKIYRASRFLELETCEDYKPNKKTEQILNLLEDIVNEKVADKQVRPIVRRNVSTANFIKARDGHLVVAALIATVAFAAAITVPGGYKSDKGSEQGTPFLIHDSAFKAFIVTEGLAFIFSLTAVAVYLDTLSPFIPNPPNSSSLKWAAMLLGCAILALMVAFSTGTYVVLKPSPGLAITSCCIGLSIIILITLKEIFDTFVS